MQLTYQKLKPFALSYLTAPLAVFFAGYLRAPFAVAGLAVLAFAWWYAVCKTPQVKQVGQEEQGITLSVPKLVLDIEKLTHFNALYLRAMEPADFARAAEPYIRQSVKDPALDAAEIAGLLQARCERLTDIPEKVDFFDALPDYDGALFTNKKSKTDPEVARAMLEAAIPALEGLDGWTTEGIHDALIALAEKLAVKNATLMWPVRIAAAGKAVTPGGAVEICHVLGREETLRRLRLGLDKLR